MHQPPPAHQVFEGSNFVICNFVPRKVDYHPLAVPVPYYHSNVDSDEVMFYCGGDYEARKGSGITQGSISLHPGGHPHGPQPGAMERSLGAEFFDELAVMVDTFRPLDLGEGARATDDGTYAVLVVRRSSAGGGLRWGCSTGFFDDAAVFPPGSLPLVEAVPAHLAHLERAHGALVGPFVVAASALPTWAPSSSTCLRGPSRCRVTVPGPGAVRTSLETAALVPALDVRAVEVGVPTAWPRRRASCRPSTWPCGATSAARPTAAA